VKKVKECCNLRCRAKVHQDLYLRVSLDFGISMASCPHSQHKAIGALQVLKGAFPSSPIRGGGHLGVTVPRRAPLALAAYNAVRAPRLMTPY
jgi:hypothetical protein